MKKKLFSLIMAVSMLIAMLPLTANALVVGDWEIEISNGEAAIIGYNGICPAEMAIPSQIGNYNVVGLKKNIFTENVKEIIVPEGYRYISIKIDTGGLSLRSICNSLESIKLPSTLEYLDTNFKECVKLKEIEIPPKVKALDGYTDFVNGNKFGFGGMFQGCTSLQKVYLHEGLERIGESAFCECYNLKELNIPNSVLDIRVNAFKNCDSLENIVIPNSVIHFGEKSTVNPIASEGAVISECDNLETVVLSDNISTLQTDHVDGRGELSGCPKLKSVYLGKSITDVMNGRYVWSKGVLADDVSLKSIIFPDGFNNIGTTALKNSYNLEIAVLPKSFVNYNTKKYGYLGEVRPFYEIDNSNNGMPLRKLYIYGYSGTDAQVFANENGFPFVDISIATPTNSRVTINGKEVAFTAYNIGGNDYFKLRDIAAAINGTGKNFNVGWDGAYNAISLTSKSSYNSVGGELTVNTSATAVEPQISNPKIFVDGKLTTFMAFNINDNNYIKLRDIGEVFDFAVDWNSATGTIEINTNRNYTE